MIKKQAPFELLDPQALEWIQTRSLKLATEINKTTMSDLKRVLSAGFERGDSIQQMTQNISGYFDGAKYRAERVARTETIAASNEGTLRRYEKEGVDKSEFYPSPDACADCIALVGEYPTKESHGKIPVHPNCRCTWLPILDSQFSPEAKPELIGGDGGKVNVPEDLIKYAADDPQGFVEGGREYRVFHGTTKENADKIIAEGLKTPEGVSEAKWYMVTTSKEEAIIFAEGYGSQAHAFVEFRIPTSELKKTLWKGFKTSTGDIQHGLRGGKLSSEYVRGMQVIQ